MARKFKRVDYDVVIHCTGGLGDGVLPGGRARLVVEVLARLELTAISAR